MLSSKKNRTSSKYKGAFQNPCSPTQRLSPGQGREGSSPFQNTLEPGASCCLPTWVSKMLAADSTIPRSLPPTALDFRLGLSPQAMGAPKIRSWGDTRAALRFKRLRGHGIFKDKDLGGNPGLNHPTPPDMLWDLGQATECPASKPQRPHLGKAHFLGVMGKSC